MSVSSNELGEMLIDLGLITSQQLVDAVSIQQISGHRLTVVLAEMGLVSERQLKDALELQFGVNFVNLSGSDPDETFVRLIPEDIERKFRFVPIAKQGTQHTVAMVDPDDLNAADMIRLHLGTNNFKKLVCTADDFEHLMKVVYGKPAEAQAQGSEPDAEPEAKVELVGKSATKVKQPKSKSPETSQTKLKSHMRNLFGSDSDDDLDDMFGGESADNLDAVAEANPAADSGSNNVELNQVIVQEEQGFGDPPAAQEKSAKKSPKKKAKSFSALFDEDDEDDVFGDKNADAEPEASVVFEADAETTVAAAEPETADVDMDLEMNPVAKLKKTSKKSSAPADQSAPQNQLLEHILDEADTSPKPTKKGKNKKSMASLFGDDDDDDMNFGDESPAAKSDDDAAPGQEAPTQWHEDEPADSDSEPVVKETISSLLSDEIETNGKSSGSGGGNPASTISKNKSFRSLFDDDDDDLGMGGDSDDDDSSARFEDQPEVQNDLLQAAARNIDRDEEDAEPEVGGYPPLEDVSKDDSEVEQARELEQAPEIESEPEVDAEPQSRSTEEAEEPPAEPAETARAPKSDSTRSIQTKQFRSLFDDEVEEDDLFGNEPALSDSLMGDSLSLLQAPQAVEEIVEQSKDDAEETAELTDEFESAESLLSAIDKPFQSLFNDEDDDEIFGATEDSKDATSENVEIEAAEQLHDVPSSKSEQTDEAAEPSAAAEIESSPAGDVEGKPEFEAVPAAYSTFDDEMDEDSLFASASHPIPEGAPQLRDLLSRFDDTDTGVESIQEPLAGASADTEASVPEPVKKDAELAVSALLAALDEQLPDEPFQAEPAAKPETAPEDRFSADKIIAELEAEEAPAMFSKLEDASATPELDKREHAQRVEPEQAGAEQPAETEQNIDSVISEALELTSQAEETTAQQEPEVAPAAAPTVAAPKSKRLRALISDLSDDDDFESLSGKPSKPEPDTAAGAAPAAQSAPESAPEPVQETSEEDESESLRELLTAGRADFEPVLMDHEILDDQYGSSTTDLPPIVISNKANTMEDGAGAVETIQPVPAAATFDEPADSDESPIPHMETQSLAPTQHLTAPTFLPENSAEVPIISATNPPRFADEPKDASDMPPLPATAAELPDALEEVLASVAFEMMDNVDLANLSGNRTEISFLEKIVESELAADENWEQDSQKAAPSAVPEPPAAERPAAVQPVAQQPAAAQIAAAQQPAAQTPATAQQPAASSTDETRASSLAAVEADRQLTQAKGLDQLDPSILNLATQILTQAVNSPCSDVHFEPLADGLALRFMSEGEVLDETILPAQIQGMLILCLKTMAGLDTAISDRPQDKKFVTRNFGEPVEMRITSIPGQHGEMVAVSLKS
ncbi:MAG: hypothetical protein SGJ27_15560 [Candidatus Melainabacteria bacterium]|nr:hypothetical protein [Candidatus Melainabacteria bacterium]